MAAVISFVSVIHIILCVLIVMAVLVQSGKGAEISASFSGSSQTVFGSSGGANFFTIFTGICAALFMFTSVFLATQGGNRTMNKSVMDTGVPASSTTTPISGAPAGAASTNGAPATTNGGTTPPVAGGPAATAAQAHGAPIGPDAATQNALSPATAAQNGAPVAPAKATPAAAAPKAPVAVSATAPKAK